MQDGGPLALIHDGDEIEIDARKHVRAINLKVSEQVLAQRRKGGSRWRGMHALKE
jgi:dihydroxyacid dehydratase/phosphogluconate dehydratase